ncbi:Calpain catalytic domain-containing protein [Mycena indigotica]|uniref:Calpain catalytic domain-containing protein n=1 Tax=Mycena indigotica TaxID=2126181 RepID=A0A8H6SWV1_9AGAR|nr:Calpain catalytic domain-containing protein [Mycena indigotica]KAF7306292.1 Calpain catalytic domain-containing protein [Mycena indigotica]
MPSSFFRLFRAEAETSMPDVDKLSLVEEALASSVGGASVGLLNSPELASVIEECRADVTRIAKQCRARNVRYRDMDFDVENDQDRCLNGLVLGDVYNPSDVQRVTELFDNPKFFSDDRHSNEVIQGQRCSNCWFISALAATSTLKSQIVEKYCVARDEQIGVYGFVFWRDTRWVSIIVDDLLYTSIPKYEELSIPEKALFQNDKEKYNTSARKGNKTLFFAKSGNIGETWVPLLEKAYAKLHGDYGSLYSGYASEVWNRRLDWGRIELYSMQVVCLRMLNPIQDILDKDTFWTEELLKSNRDRLFACSFHGLNPTRNGNFNATISGLWGNHSYAVLRALEFGGKRFLVLRNPCGQAEWNGPWSDGSKDWTPEWMEALPALGHVFGDPGKFIMEYKDFLLCFEQIDRTRLFDSSWTVRSQVVRVSHPRPFPESGLGYGDVCFTFSLSTATAAVIVLSQLDVRFFKGLSPACYWNFDFVLYRRGQKAAVDTSPHSRYTSRSVSLEFAELEAGEYIVHCRLDKVPFTDKTNHEEWSQSKVTRVVTQRAESESVATNVEIDWQEKNVPIPLRILAGQDLADLCRKADTAKAQRKRTSQDSSERDSSDDVSTEGTKVNDEAPGMTTTITTIKTVRTGVKIMTDTKEVVLFGRGPPPSEEEDNDDDDEEEKETRSEPTPDSAAPFIGLKVYTPAVVDVVVKAQLRHDMRLSFAGLKVDEWKLFGL